MSDQTTLQLATRFSESILWDYQKDYFASKGINAWIGAVPFYVTSNTLIAISYAQISLRYIQDNLRNNTLDPKQPIYIFEMGTGPGKFSYLFLLHFTKFLRHFKLDHLPICYVMTDFTDQNLAFWQNQEHLQPFAKQGILDFAIFDIGKDDSVFLQNKKITLSKGSCANPVIMIANYIFDTVTHDAFHISKGQLQEGMPEVKIDNTAMDGDKPRNLEELQTHFYFRDIKVPYYNDPALDNILSHYTQTLDNTTVLIPVGGIQCIDALRALSNNKILVIAGDKGYTSEKSLQNLSTPHIAFHGSFSMMVNFHAVAEYCKNLGGDSRLAFDSDGFKISVFTLGCTFAELPETDLAYNQYITHLSTKEFLLIKNKIIEHAANSTLNDLVALLKFSYWDPDIMLAIAPALVEKLRDGSQTLRDECFHGFAQIFENYYFIPNNKNVYFELGYLYHTLNAFPEALNCYLQAVTHFAEDAACYFNVGLCLYNVQRLPEALLYFEKSLAKDPSSTTAKEWIEFIKKSVAAE